ncbi:hypothetical protein [Gloeothece citriformis]|uniref:hypothetical protein n=1 Tax=Gloeothece citriformis TaxID=2546356 RepID=UPI00059CE406|nr:hypothetical protein [Gloeothece citriformis]
MRYRDEMVANSDHRKEGFLFGFGVVIDSLSLKSKFKFDVDRWIDSGQPYVVFLDEIEQLLWHLLDSNTEVKNNRLEIEENFRKLLSPRLSGGDWGCGFIRFIPRLSH